MGPVEPAPPPPPPPPDAEPPSPHEAWARASMWIVIVLILAASGVLMFKACVTFPIKVLQKTGETIEKATDTLATVAGSFRRGTISTSFVSYATSITNSQHLQFATVKQMELFTRTEEPSTAFGYMPLPDVVVEARAPVEYTYYLDLKAKWRFELRDEVLEVFAPAIRANKPAIDVSALSYEVKKGRFKSTEAVDNLKRSISSLVVLRAKENIHLVKETGRKETAEFVETWLSRSFADGKNYVVKVYFPGETPPDRITIAPRLSHESKPGTQAPP